MSEVGDDVDGFDTDDGEIDEGSDDARCGYCGGEDSSDEMQRDSEGVVTCWDCARDNGSFVWGFDW